MTTKCVEDRILEQYSAGDGTWLVEKGKMKEAKLIKEAYERIESLKKDCAAFHGDYVREYQARLELKRSLEAREQNLKLREEQFARDVQRLRENLDKWQN